MAPLGGDARSLAAGGALLCACPGARKQKQKSKCCRSTLCAKQQHHDRWHTHTYQEASPQRPSGTHAHSKLTTTLRVLHQHCKRRLHPWLRISVARRAPPSPGLPMCVPALLHLPVLYPVPTRWAVARPGRPGWLPLHARTALVLGRGVGHCVGARDLGPAVVIAAGLAAAGTRDTARLPTTLV